MNENTLDDRSLELPENLQAKLREFQRIVWTAKVIEGLLAGLFGLFVAYLLVFVMDRFWDTPSSLRALILVAGASGLGFWFPIKMHRWVWKRRSLEQIARLLRHRYPRFGDQLLGIVELARHASGSETLIRAAFRQADEAISKTRLDRGAIPNSQVLRWSIITAVVTGWVLLTLTIVPKAGWNSMSRSFFPWLNTERYTFAQSEGAPHRLVVPYGEPFELAIDLRENSDWRPQSAKAWFRDQEPVVVNLDEERGRYQFNLQSRRNPGKLHLHIGDEKRSIHVQPETRPELTSLVAKVKLPDYLRYERDLEVPVLDGAISLVEGSEASFVGTTSRDLSFAFMDKINQETEGPEIHLDPIYVTDSTNHTVHWQDELGLTSRSPLELRIRAQKDSEPGVTAKMITQEQVVLEDDVVTFDVRVSDDFGIQEVGLAWVGETGTGMSKSNRGRKVVAAGNPEQLEIKTESATFSAKRERVKPQTIQIAAYALDYMPGRKPVYSQPMVLHIMSPEEHAVWMTGEFGKWFRRAQEVYEREQQLHLTNQELRKLSAEELDQEENRRRIEAQAASERVNAKRLDALNKAGRELIESAARNDEFEAKNLELWAQMLDQLDGIAQKRMPSVADLLKKAADSEKGQSGDGGEESQPGKMAQGGDSSSDSEEPDADKRRSLSVAENKQTDPQQNGGGGTGKQKPGMSMSDQESGHMPKVPDEGGQKPSSGGSSALGLPSTSLGAVPGEKKEQQPSEAQARVEEGVMEQTGLLDEFARISDQLKELLGTLEASTFVKRLKAASREQLAIASDLNGTLSRAFGTSHSMLDKSIQEAAETLAVREEEQGEVVHTIQEDLEAYFHRKREQKYKNVLEQMHSMEAVSGLQEIGSSIRVNLNGRSISAAEYWADHLDRWAEEMVSAAQDQQQGSGDQEAESLPPEVVLEVMKLLHEEIELREETREMEKSKDALEIQEYKERTAALAETQKQLRNRAYRVANQIQGLPYGAQKFPKPIELLNKVAQVMGEAHKILSEPSTGPDAIAAETEAIELLLETRRQNPNGGGGGGSSPGGGGGGMASGSALSGIGPGADRNAKVEERDVKQNTGKEEREFPEEFRDGLDAYFNALEREK